MKIIITGGLGFVGRAVAAKALKLDGVDEILVVGRNVSPEPAKILPEFVISPLIYQKKAHTIGCIILTPFFT